MISQRRSGISCKFGNPTPVSRKVFNSFRCGALVFLCGVFFYAPAATLPSGFSETMIAGSLTAPTAMDFAPDGRIFVCLQAGDVRVLKNDVLLPTPFMTLTVDALGERGLLGVAFDPNFATNNFVYFYYTVPGSPPHNRVSRFTANGDVVLAGSEVPILDLENLTASNHNGGAIHFGPDGRLYVAVGENAVGLNSQTLNNRLGKILRINSDGTIPADNPFFNTATGVNRSIWALGLRNPFTFAFQPNSTRMFINDVGELTWEEINDGIPGSNYGWPNNEGPTSDPAYRSPLFAYGHGSSSTTGCAITGGAFYNPTNVQFPASYVGKYFFADLCSGWIRLFDPRNSTVENFASGIANPVDLKVSPDGVLYYLSYSSAAVFRVISIVGPPVIIAQPSSQTVMPGQPVTFSVVAISGTPVRYEWILNDMGNPNATSSSFSYSAVNTCQSGSRLRVAVFNNFGRAISREVILTVPPCGME